LRRDGQARQAERRLHELIPGRAASGWLLDDVLRAKLLARALFIETAREIGADEKRSAADELMGQIANMKAEPKKSKG
jgi:hypothetical protein